MRAHAFLLILLAIVDKNLFAAHGSVVGRILAPQLAATSTARNRHAAPGKALILRMA
jgi:hypothetical protein